MKKILLLALSFICALTVSAQGDGGEDCECPDPSIFELVCVVTDNGDIEQYPSICFAQCAGYDISETTECESTDLCDCDEEDLGNIVCVTDSVTGIILPLPECFALCLELDVTECDSTIIIDPWVDCDCPEIETDTFICILTDTVTGLICPFPSLCFAECQGYTADDIVDCGDFGDGSGGGSGGGDFGCFDCLEEELIPVCVLDTLTGDTVQVPNLCFAECLGLEVVDSDDCTGFGGHDCDCPFPDGDETVCVTDQNGFTLTYPSLCFAECDGYTVADTTDCGRDDWNDWEDCDCDLESDSIVCVLDTLSGTVFPFPQCLADCFELPQVECDSTIIIDPWGDDCDCPEPEVDSVICVLTDPATGLICPFPSLCYAECAGYTEADVVDCGDGGHGGGDFDCISCLDEPLDPVCVLDTLTGDTVQVPNICFADCLGLPIVDSNDCTGGDFDCDCVFSDADEEVCIAVGQDTIWYPSLCFAECDGYTVDDVVTCPEDDFDNCCPDPDDFDDIVCVQDSTIDFVIEVPRCLAECFGLTIVDCPGDDDDDDGSGVGDDDEGDIDDDSDEEEVTENAMGIAGSNIVSDQLNLEIKRTEMGSISIQVRPLGSGLGMQQDMTMDSGIHQVQLDVSAMNTGVHIVQVSDGEHVEIMKILIVR